MSGYRERLFKFVEAQSVELTFSERIAPAKGLSHGGKITLLSGMQPAEEFSTLVHEIAHEMLHRGDRRTLTTKQVRETEAEAVAFVVCQSVGLQNGTASQDYIQLWHGDGNLFGHARWNGRVRRNVVRIPAIKASAVVHWTHGGGHRTILVGRVCVLCSCGVRGCLEPYVNAAALIRYAGNSHSTAAQVIAAANAGDEKANAALRTLACHLARGCATLIALLDPQALILGGGLTENNPFLITVLFEELAKLVRPWEDRCLRIVPSQLGYYGGVLGAAALAFERVYSLEPNTS